MGRSREGGRSEAADGTERKPPLGAVIAIKMLGTNGAQFRTRRPQVGVTMSSPRPSPIKPVAHRARTPVAIASSLRAATLLGVSVAMGSAILGLAVLGAASLGLAGFRILGFALLSVGGAMAALLRWKRWQKERHELDREAVADLMTAQACLELGDHPAAAAAASRAATRARTRRTRNAALTTLAWAALGQGYTERARAALDGIEPSYEVDLYCLSAVESARGKPEKAIAALEVARTAGILTCEGAKLLIDCYVRHCGIDRAIVAATQNRAVLGAENCRIVLKAACDAGAGAAAATLISAIRSDMCAPLHAVKGAHVG
jgi:hypothetical protein